MLRDLLAVLLSWERAAAIALSREAGSSIDSADFIASEYALSWPGTEFGAAFATYQQRNLAMDLVSRRLAPRGRMVLRIVLGFITIFIAGVFTYGGLRFVDVGIKSDDHLADILTAWAMPIGGGLIIFHSLIQLIIEVDYLVRGKLTPDRERTH